MGDVESAREQRRIFFEAKALLGAGGMPMRARAQESLRACGGIGLPKVGYKVR